ncbi:MAG: N-acetylmuramoyl-L-alanine amidase [Melioribacteraceae bacterium]
MKKLFLFLLLTKSIFAQDLFGTKIYINPGHGGFDSNDRNIPETGFWESTSNLDKGLALRTILQQINATVYMSRVTNTSADDFNPLSIIVADANAKNVDFFHAIHSNGFNGQSNYTLMLFQGKDNAPTYAGALTMGSYLTDEIYKANRTTAKYNRGDIDFYAPASGGLPYLGVFKNLNVPGTLSEGSFHDYIPESWRLMNSFYKKHEAWAIARGFLKYFTQPGFQTGTVAGLVRDQNKSVSYFALTAKNDHKLPLNNIKVTLEPGGKVYNGDGNNNGFFLFDSLAPGSYKVYFEAPGYYKDSSTVTVTANVSSFADKFLLYDTTVVAQIVSYSPSSATDSVKTIASVSIRFDLPMDTSSTNAAFQITPAAQGVFSWGDGNKVFTFKPSLPYFKATEYTIVLKKSAKTIWGIQLSNDLTFKFITKNRNRYFIEKTYPSANSVINLALPQFRLQFEAPVLNASLSGQINLYNNERVRLTAINVKIFAENGKGLIYFETKDALANGEYALSLGGKIADVDSIPMVDSVEIPFTIFSQLPSEVNLIDDFETQIGWKNPSASPHTVGVDTLTSLFSITTEKKLFGSKSGKLIYLFKNAENGNCVVPNEAKIVLNGEMFGTWVFGDLSNNYFNYWFEDENNAEFSIQVDSLDWAGWKFVRSETTNFNGRLKNKLVGISVEQRKTGNNTGTLFFDNLRFYLWPDLVDDSQQTPVQYSLDQNYPNPFNPETVISYQLPENSFVTLKIFDVLGNEVAILVNESQQAGKHNYELGIRNYELSSGIYFYQLRAGDFIQTKKMIVLK